jgi:hypothetical protein
MELKRILCQRVLSFLSVEGINDDTSLEENNDGDHGNMVTAANGKDEPHGNRTADCLLWLMDQLKKAHAVFLACKKGDGKGADHLAKVLN